MKKNTLTVALAVLAMLAYAQTEIPKNTNKIIAHNSKSASENFVFVKQILADKDILISKQDNDIHQIKTGDIPINQYTSYTFLINCRDSLVSFTGTWTNNIGINAGGITMSPSTYPINYKGNIKLIFDKMDAIAKLVGQEIKYEGGDLPKVKGKKSK